MDHDLILIFGFTLCALWIIFRRPEWRRRHSRKDAEPKPAEEHEIVNRELLEQLTRIEERVKVLERIVTDDPRELRKQFRDLAD